MPKLRIVTFISMQTFGRKGENLAAEYLVRQGYRVVEKNYRFKKSEIDLICQKDGLLIFVEVKTRSSRIFGQPESFVSEAQKAAIIRAAEQICWRWTGMMISVLILWQSSVINRKKRYYILKMPFIDFLLVRYK